MKGWLTVLNTRQLTFQEDQEKVKLNELGRQIICRVTVSGHTKQSYILIYARLKRENVWRPILSRRWGWGCCALLNLCIRYTPIHHGDRTIYRKNITFKITFVCKLFWSHILYLVCNCNNNEKEIDWLIDDWCLRQIHNKDHTWAKHKSLNQEQNSV